MPKPLKGEMECCGVFRPCYGPACKHRVAAILADADAHGMAETEALAKSFAGWKSPSSGELDARRAIAVGGTVVGAVCGILMWELLWWGVRVLVGGSR